MAVHFRKLNVDKMLRKMTAKRFLEWEHYSRIEPFGEQRGDYQAASIATVIANSTRGTKQEPFKIEDFLLKFEEPKKRQTPDQQLAIARMIAAMYSATQKAS